MSDWHDAPLAGSLPWVNLAMWLAPMVLLGWRWRVFPSWTVVGLLAFPAVTSFLVVAEESIAAYVHALSAVLWVAAAVDLFTTPRRGAFTAERSALLTASLGQGHLVELWLSNHSKRPLRVVVRDDPPHEFDCQPEEFPSVLPPRSRRLFKYRATPRRRGAFTFDRVYVKCFSRFGLWRRYLELPLQTRVNVYPDMKQLSEYAILARTDRLSLMGLRRTRRIGQDNEFERLRDYTRDDNHKHIDWRATARRNKLTVKDFQSNQSQRVLFLIDCGRMMTNQSRGLTLLDHALNAALMLSYVALRQGDSVGQICFSNRVHSYVPPRGGVRQMNHLIHASFDQFPSLVESRYDDAFLYLATHCRKRSLVVLISNVVDEVNSNQVRQYLAKLVGRHLPLGVLLRDHSLFELAERKPEVEADIFRSAAAAEVLLWRRQTLVDLMHSGVLALDVFPEEMTSRLVNEYLRVKARRLL